MFTRDQIQEMTPMFLLCSLSIVRIQNSLREREREREKKKEKNTVLSLKDSKDLKWKKDMFSKAEYLQSKILLQQNYME